MQFDPENTVNKLCAQGMMLEGEGKVEEAMALFGKAWDSAQNDTEKLTAAHYIARQQETVADKLRWDNIALNLALNINTIEVKAIYPSLYLNVAKCYEDMQQPEKARHNYREALKYTSYLPKDGYGDMIRAGINNGISRVSG
jgi:tetratricopeptide (TPR) repeat protein